jgi:succinoglycan biosynthesis protein ExoW
VRKNTKIKIAIILPYYQRDPGILARALTSVISQNIPKDVLLEVIVIDDESPSPVMKELPKELPDFVKIRVIPQQNGGCANARNTGLAAVGNDIRYIAFLDSDDFWGNSHIQDALLILEKGYEFYFCDNERPGLHASQFQAVGFPTAEAVGESAVWLGENFWKLSSDVFFEFFFRQFTTQISTVMFRREAFPNGRFNEKLRAAGEDYLFLLQLTQSCSCVSFSNKINVTCGEGVNVYNGAYSWHDEGHLRRVMGDILAMDELRQGLDLGIKDLKILYERRKYARRQFAYFAMRWWLKKMPSWSQLLWNLTRADTKLKFWFLPSLLYVCIFAPVGVYKPVEHP